MASKLIDNLLTQLSKGKYANKRPSFNSGDTLNVYVKVKDGEKERVQLFKGVVIKIQNAGNHCSFTVRKISNGVGVEKTFMLASPSIDKIEKIRKGKVRRARLFYLRKLVGKAAHVKSDYQSLAVKAVKGPKKSPETSTQEQAIQKQATQKQATLSSPANSDSASNSASDSASASASASSPAPDSTATSTSASTTATATPAPQSEAPNIPPSQK